MKKRIIIAGISLAVLGTGIIVNKLRKRNNEVEELKEGDIVTEEVAIDEPVEGTNKEEVENETNTDEKSKIRINDIINTCGKIAWIVFIFPLDQLIKTYKSIQNEIKDKKDKEYVRNIIVKQLLNK